MRVKASLGMVLGLLAAPAAWGQDVKPATPPKGPHVMEIFDGPSRTVHYIFPANASPGERQMYRDLERAENEQSYVANLQALRRQYVTGERMLEARRQIEQQQLYGWNFDRAFGAGYLGGAYPAAPYSYPYYGYGYYGAGPYWGASLAVSQTLGTGIAPDGVIKQEMAKIIALNSTPEYTAKVDRQLSEAVAALPADGKEVPVATHEILTLKSGDKIEGRVIREDADWIVMQTAAGGREKVRTSDVVRVSTKPPEKK
jgi:hypothetical protein